MTYRSWHLITIRFVATSWAFAAEIISMINTAMSFGAGLVGAEINLENTQQRNGHKSKHIVAAEICSFITYSKMFLPSIRIWRIHSHTHTHTRPSNAISYACTRCSGRSKLNQSTHSGRADNCRLAGVLPLSHRGIVAGFVFNTKYWLSWGARTNWWALLGLNFHHSFTSHVFAHLGLLRKFSSLLPSQGLR